MGSDSPPKVPAKSQLQSQAQAAHNKQASTKAQPLHPSKNHALQPGQKKVPHRSGKPIINWLQRKWTGTVRSKRTAENMHAAAEMGRTKGRKDRMSSRSSSRAVSSPLPSPGVTARPSKLEPIAPVRRKTVSLNGDDISPRSSLSDDRSSLPSSLARDSTYSAIRALEADEDASMRPLPPSSPPSPSPSRSSSSYLSDPHTFKSMAASTKPTTLLSVDLNGGMAHIAQAPLTPSGHRQRTTHARTSSNGTNLINSGASITFSALPPSPTRSNTADSTTGDFTQAPLHTAHHPRNNPRPSSPPIDNASVFTLASSAYAIPGMRSGPALNGWSSAPPSALGYGDSISHMDSIGYPDAESNSHWGLGDEGNDERDFDASVRALRPRSSRRGSWESEASRWSARVQGAGTSSMHGTSLIRERSLWTTNSLKTGNPSELDNGDQDEYDYTSAPGDVQEVIAEEDPVAGEKGQDSSMTVTKPAASTEEAPLLHVKDTVGRKLSSETIGTPNPASAVDDDRSGLPKSSSETEIATPLKEQLTPKEELAKVNDDDASPSKDKELLLTPTL